MLFQMILSHDVNIMNTYCLFTMFCWCILR